MEGWKEYKVEETSIEMIDGDRGKNYPKNNDFFTEGYCLFLNAGNVTKNGFSFSENSFITREKDDTLRKGRLERNDVVITTRGTVGNIALYDTNVPFEHIRINSGMLILKSGKDILPEYLYYFLKGNTFQTQISQYVSGSAQPQLPKGTLAKMTISYPNNKDTQKRIITILKSLDDKIECNRRINENLEQQAQALFKSWFVDFEPFRDEEFKESELGMIPKGWRLVSLDEMTSKFGTGLNPRKNFKLGEGNNYYVTIKNMGNNRVYLDDKCDKVTDEAIQKINKRSKLQAGDLLFSGIGTIGRVALITETPTNWNTSESVFNMHPAENISSEFLYIFLLSDVFQQYVKQHAQGGVQQGIRMASLKEYKMALPNNDILREFDKMVVPLVSSVKINDCEIDSLASLRDSLLPKLMSGELKVGDVTL